MSLAYTRLSGKKRSFSGYTQLWLASDHLLLLTNSRFTEQYQRFLLADIQAITATDKTTGTAHLSVAAVGVLWSMIALAVSSNFAKGFFLITGVLLLAMVAIDFLRGPRCICVLQTAVSRKVLAPVARRSQVLRFLAAMRPVIDAAQATPASVTTEPPPLPLAAAELGISDAAAVAGTPVAALQSGEANVVEAGVTALMASQAVGPAETLFGVTLNPSAAPPALPQQSFRLQWILFGALLLTGPMVWLALSKPAQVVTLLPSVFMTEFVLAAMVLLQGRTEPFKPTYLLAIVTLVVMLFDLAQVSGVAAWFAFMDLMKNPAAAATESTGLHAMRFSTQNAILFAIGWRVALGALGMAAWLFEKGGVVSSSPQSIHESSGSADSA